MFIVEAFFFKSSACSARNTRRQSRRRNRSKTRSMERGLKEEKKTVAISKSHAMDKVYKELETPKGERNIYRTAKARDKSDNDITQIRRIKDEQEWFDGNMIKS